MIDIYTDGSCGAKDRCGGWAFVAVQRSKKFEPDAMPKHAMPDDKTVHRSGGERDTTVNRMELMAIYRALTFVQSKNMKRSKIRIFSDSAYSIGSLNDWHRTHRTSRWKNSQGEPIANMKLIRTTLVLLHDLKQQHDIVFVKIKGHSGHHYNEEADRLASAERAKRL